MKYRFIDQNIKFPTFGNRLGMLFIFYLITIIFTSAQTIRYVKSGGGGNGSNWENAAGDLQNIINTSSEGDEVWVVEGMYSGSQNQAYINMKQGVKIYGGFSGIETAVSQRNIGLHKTIIQGMGDSAIKNDNNGLDYTAVLDGFTIDGGEAYEGAGMYNKNSSPTISNCVFTNNYATWGGGGIFNNSSSPMIINCDFVENYADRFGGGICNVSESLPTIIHCDFILNRVMAFDSMGGGIYNANYSSPAIIDCYFSNNIAESGGGGIMNRLSSPVINSSTFVNNLVGDALAASIIEGGGGVCNIEGSNAKINNCVFFSNSAENGGAIYDEGYSEALTVINNSTFVSNGALTGGQIFSNSIKINNSIIWNSLNGGEVHFTSSDVEITYSIVEGGYLGEGNLVTDPLFVNQENPAGSDGIYGTTDDGLQLLAGSPAINGGDPQTNMEGYPLQTGETDILGTTRIQDLAVDMGAYESFYSETIYVDGNIETSGAGDSWGTALKTLREALEFANQYDFIHTIYIATGTYYPTGIQSGTDRNMSFLIPRRGGIELYGGYPNGGGTRDIKAHPTILSGDIGVPDNKNDNSYHVVTMNNAISQAEDVVIDGFTVSGGNAPSGGGGLLFYNNSGINDKIIIRNCTIIQNTAGQEGGGIYLWKTPIVISNCIISHNTSGRDGGGIFIFDTANPYIVNSIISNNVALNGGGWLSKSATSSPLIINTTFYGNTANSGDNINNSDSSKLTVINSIIWSSTAANNIYNTAILNITYSNIQGGYGGTGNINKDPQFINPSDPDGEDNVWGTVDDGFMISPCSSAMNLGNNMSYTNFGGDLANDFDLAGNPRLYDETIDMGPYEGQGELCEITWIGSPQTGYWNNGTGPGLDDDAQVEGTLVISSALQAKEFRVLESGSVTINDGGSLTLAGRLINENEEVSSFTVKSGGNLIQTTGYTANDNQGGITVQRESQDIVRLDYTLWASPTADQQLQAFSPMTLPGRIYTYETNAENQATDGNYEMVSDANANFASGRGYLFRAPNDWNETHNNQEAPYPGEFIGKPFNGNVNVPVYPNGYTSVGNPYPSNISPEEILGQNPGVTNLYFWNNPERIYNAGTGTWGYTGTRYISYSTLGFSNPFYEGSSIAVGQGFIVYSTGSNVNFNNSMRVSSKETFFKVDGTERDRIWINLSYDNGQVYNQVLAGYMTGATNGIDEQIDAPFFGYTGSALYNMINDQKFTIQGLEPPFETSDIIPLGFKAEQAGKFKISLAGYDGLFAEGEVKIYLKDKLLHIIHNMLETDYTFESAAGDFKDRFEVVFEPEEILGTEDLNQETARIYLYDQNIVVESGAGMLSSVELYDLQGRLLHTENINSSLYKFKSPVLKSQVLVVKARTQDGEVTTKKIVYK